MTQHKTQHAVPKAKQTEKGGGGYRDCFTMEKGGGGWAEIISEISMGRGWGGNLLHHTTKREIPNCLIARLFSCVIYMSVLTHFHCNSFLLIFVFQFFCLFFVLILLDTSLFFIFAKQQHYRGIPLVC